MNDTPPAAQVLPARPGLLDNAWTAAGLYLAVVVVIKWPLVLGLTTDLPSDFGDPAFIAWALARASVHWTALLSGDLSAAVRFWDANIFHPAPLTGAFSEHFAGHALLTLPLWWLTGNVLVSYNVLFLASSVLCGLGMYLLARDLTGRGSAAFVAGLCFACAPYRVSTAPHLQVQTAQWMPFAFMALRRFIQHGRLLPLAGGVAAIWLQNLSSGYYMLFFAPLCGLWSAWWLWAAGQWANLRRTGGLLAGAALALALTWPFASPYLELQRQLGGARRSLTELSGFSADLGAWLTASPNLNLWGWVRLFPKPEGELFLGLALPALALLGVITAAGRDATRAQRVTVTFAAAIGSLAFWMALGPTPTVLGRPLGVPSLFVLAYEHVPGFNVARVPSRFQMILLLVGSLVAAFGAARIRQRWLLAAVAALAIADGTAVPFPRNLVWAPTAELHPPPDRLHPSQPPGVYRYLATLDDRAAVVHFPLGANEYDLRFMVYSATHRASMMNGYSGAFPVHWPETVAALSRPMLDVKRAWSYMEANGVTHAIVHRDVWRDDTGARLAEALTALGAKVVFQDGGDMVFQLPFSPLQTTNGR